MQMSLEPFFIGVNNEQVNQVNHVNSVGFF